MRRLVFAAALWAQPLFAAAPAPPPATRLAEAEVANDRGPQVLTQHNRTFLPGGSSGWHSHPGIEVGHVLSGITEMRLADGTRRLYRAGESFVVPRGVVHNGINAGRGPARLLITYVVDKGAPQRIDAPDPAAH
ncbi:MAG: cupin domain-containing protein [Novosphingobium sp.]